MNESIGHAQGGVSGFTANNLYGTWIYTPTTTTSGVIDDEDVLYLVAFVDPFEKGIINYKNTFYISADSKEYARDLAIRRLTEEQFELYRSGDLKVIVKEI